MLRASTSPPRRFPRWLRVLAVLQALILAGLACAYLLTLRAPSWWREVPSDAKTAAEQVENGVVTQLSLVRPADPGASKGYQSREWSVSISAADADAWLGTRLKPWVENQGGHWPEQLTGAQVEFSPGSIKAGVHLAEGVSGRIVYVEVAPEVRTDGSLWLLPRGMGAGAMPLPAWLVFQEMREGVLARLPAGKRAQAEEALDVLAGRRPALKDAVIKLEDGRSVRLLKVTPVEGRLEITCRTEKK